MKLIKLTATFGCLQGETLEFSDGLTLVGAPNGGGKSTWCAFLRTMLYGLDTRQRDKKGIPADKNRYRPWNGAPMEGLMLCRHQGQLIEIRRTSADGVPMGTFSAKYPETGLDVPGLTGSNTGEFLTGVNRAVFDRSVFLSQTGMAVHPNQELEERITSLVSTGEESTISWSQADEQLKSWQRRRRFHKTGLLPQLESEKAALLQTQHETSELRQTLSQLQSKAAELRQQKEHWDNRLSIETDKFQTMSQRRYAEAAAELDAAELHCQTLHAKITASDSTLNRLEDSQRWEEDIQDIQEDLRSRRRILTIFTVLVILCSLVSVATYILPRYPIPQLSPFLLNLPEIPLLLLASTMGILWLLVLLFAIIKAVYDHRDNRDLTALQAKQETYKQDENANTAIWEEAVARREQAQKYFDIIRQQSGGPYLPPEAEACQESLQHTEREIARLQGQLSALGDPVLVDARLDHIQEEESKLQEDYDALSVAIDALQEADRQLHARFSPQLSSLAGAYLSALTNHEYDQVSVTRSLDLTVREPGSLTDRPLALLSQGTADQLYLSLRLAISELVLPDPTGCPLILDDALLSFDEQRLALALNELLRLAKNRQVLLFTCRHREWELLRQQETVTSITIPGF